MQPRRRNHRRSIVRRVELEACGTWTRTARPQHHRRHHSELERSQISVPEWQSTPRLCGGAPYCLLRQSFLRPFFSSELGGAETRCSARIRLSKNSGIAPLARRGRRICPSAMPSCAFAGTPATSWGRGYCSHHPALDGYLLLHFRATESLRRSRLVGRPAAAAWPSAEKGYGNLPVPLISFILLNQLRLRRAAGNQPRRAHVIHDRAEDRRQLRKILVRRSRRLAALAVVGVEIRLR